LPLWDRNLLYVNSEAIAERCNEGLISLFPLPVPPKGAPVRAAPAIAQHIFGVFNGRDAGPG
jgi:hypothetical protein